MKNSQYNLFIPSSQIDELILYNTLRGGVFLINKKTKTLIENINSSKIASDVLFQTFIKEGIIVDDFVDEKAIFKVYRDRVKYGSRILRLVIIPTFLCNLNCTYCYVSFVRKLWKQKKIYKKSMNNNTADLILKFINTKLKENNYNEIIVDFTGGGEPLLKTDIIFYILKSLQLLITGYNIKLSINMISNGTLISEKLLEYLRKYNIYFQITLDGYRTIHNTKRIYKNGKGTYDQIIKGLQLLKDFELKYIIRINVDKDVCEHIEILLDDLIDKLGIGLFIRFLPLIPGKEEYCTWRSSCLINKDLNVISNLWELASQKGFNLVLDPLIKYFPCKAMVDHSFVIVPFGDLYKCESQAGIKKLRIGTIDDNGRLSKFHYPYYEMMTLDPLENNYCKNCSLLPACGGECPLVYKSNTYYQNSCSKSKHLIIQNIKFQLKRFYPNICLKY